MALDNIQNKYTKGTGSPEGVVKGKRGFVYEDDATNDAYEAIGGDQWRKTVHENIPLIPRHLPVQMLPEELEDLVQGETIYLEDRQANFKVIGKQKRALDLKANLSNTSTQYYESTSFPSIIFESGDTLEMDIKLNSYGSSFTSSMLFRINNTFNLSLLKGSGIIIFPIAGSNISFEIYDSKGKLQTENEIKIGKWQRVKFTFNTTVTSSSVLRIGNLETVSGNFPLREIDLNIKNIVTNRNNSGTPEIDSFQVENYNESNGYLPNQSNSKIFTTKGSKTISDISLVDVNLLQIPTNKQDVLELIIDENVVTPENFGYKSNTNLIFENSISPYLQKCVETGKTIHVAGGFHYWDEPIEFTNNQIIMFDGADIDADTKEKTDTTFFYTDKPVDFARIFTNMIISGGVVSYKTFENPEDYYGILNPVAYRIIPLGEMYNLQIRDINVVNVRQRLIRGADIGCIGVLFDVGVGGFKDPIYNNHPNPLFGTLYGGVSRLYISGTFEGLNYSIKFPKYVDEYANTIRGWHNSVTINANSHNAKVHLFIDSGNIYDINLQEQDYGALVDSERRKYANYLNATNITHNIFLYDVDTKVSDHKSTWRHFNYNIFSKDKSNVALGRSLMGYELDFINIVNSNKNTIINDPERLVLSDNKKNMISKLDNQVRFSGYLPSFSFKGYIMPDDIDLFPSGNAASAIPVTSTSGWVNEIGNPDITVENIEGIDTIKITPAVGVSSESSAKIKIDAEIGKEYRLSFDYKVGVGQAQKFRLEGAKQVTKINRINGIVIQELDYNLGDKNFTKQEHFIVAESTEVWLVFEAITGDVIKVRDKVLNQIVEAKNNTPNGIIQVNTNFFKGRTYKMVLETDEGGSTETVEFNYTCTDDLSARSMASQITEAMQNQGMTGWSCQIFGGWVVNINIPNGLYSGITNFRAYQYGDETYTINVKNIKVLSKWKDNNKYPAHLSLNSGANLIEANSSDVEIQNIDLLKENKFQNRVTLKNEKSFVEVFCELHKAGKLLRILSSHFGTPPKLIQGILYREDLSYIADNTIGNENEILNIGTYDIFDKSWVERNSNVKYICIRYIYPSQPNAVFDIHDIMVATQYGEYNPVIDGTGGNIFRTLRGFSSEAGVGNNHLHTDSDVYVEFNSNKEIDIRNYKTTIFLNNTSGSIKTLTFNTGNNTKEFAGRKYKFVCVKGNSTDFVDGIGNYNPSNDILIPNDQIVTKDRKGIILKPGDIIEVELLQTTSFGRCRMFETFRSRPKELEITTSNITVENEILSKYGVVDKHVWHNKTILPYSFIELTNNNTNVVLNNYTNTIYVTCTADDIPIIAFNPNSLKNCLGRTFTIYATKNAELVGADMTNSKPFQIQVLGNQQGIERMDYSAYNIILESGDFVELKVMDFMNPDANRAKVIYVGGNIHIPKVYKTNHINLSKTEGNIYNIHNSDKKNYSKYIFTDQVVNGKARILINAPSEPVIFDQIETIISPKKVLEVDNYSLMPVNGSSDTSYRTKNDGEIYLWDGTQYVMRFQIYSTFADLPVTGITHVRYYVSDTKMYYTWASGGYTLRTQLKKSFKSQPFKPNTDMYLSIWVDDLNNIRYTFESTTETIDITSVTSIETADTGTEIGLTTVGGNLCNMASANTNKTFTTTGDVLNAFAEVLVNRVDQPEITEATYKPDKGVPFVPSTDMIMRVENKGVPRGVQYWFEEI